MPFGTDQVVMYNVSPWKELGFGVPSFGDDLFTVNSILWRLSHEIGLQQLHIMVHVDAMRPNPPGPNTLMRMCKLLNRIKAVLLGRQKQYSEVRTEAGHGTPAQKAWLVHPVPYFRSDILQNGWLSEYNELTMVALSNIYQHTENALPLTITNELAADIWQYFRDISILIGTELLNLPKADVMKDEFQFTDAHYAAYKPETLTTRVESIATPPSPFSRFTEDDLRPLVEGIPSNLIVANLARYPVGPHDQTYQGVKTEAMKESEAAPGTVDGSALDPVL